MSDTLQAYVEIWWQAIDDLTTMLEGLSAEQWRLPTDLPGWDIHAVAAHIAHLESLLAGGRHVEVDVGEPAHVRSPMGIFTEQGVQERSDRSADELINEIRSSATTRHTALLADPPTDGASPAPGLFGSIGWSTELLLRNRPLDVWMHEQDIRRAIGEPGNLDSTHCEYVVDYLSESMPFVLAKRAKAEPGSTLRLRVGGHAPRAFVVDQDGRGKEMDEVPSDPTVTLTMDPETFIILAGGRRGAAADAVEVSGDADLGALLITRMGVTP